MNILQIRNLNLELGNKKILNNLNIDFWDGHIHAIVGPNGAGKSTLSYAIMGLSGYNDYKGDIIFKNKSIKKSTIDERAKMGITLAWQEPARFEGLKVKDYIKISSKDKSENIVDFALEKVGLNPSEYSERAVDRSLSGGERKRIELASILVMQPNILLLDEPDSGIDVAALEKIFDMIEYLKNNGSTIILVTHSKTVLEHADHAFLLCNGTIHDKGNISDIKKYFENKCLPCEIKDGEC